MRRGAAFAREVLRLWRERGDNPLVVYGAPWKRGPGFAALYFAPLLGHAALIAITLLRGDGQQAERLLAIAAICLLPTFLYMRLYSWTWWDRERLQEWALTPLPPREIVFGAYCWAAIHGILHIAIMWAGVLAWVILAGTTFSPPWEPDAFVTLVATALGAIPVQLACIAVSIRANVLMGGAWVRAHLWSIIAIAVSGLSGTLLGTAAIMTALALGRTARRLAGEKAGIFGGGRVFGDWDSLVVACVALATALLLSLRCIRESLAGLEAAVLRPIDPDHGHRGLWWARESAVKARLGRSMPAEVRASLSAVLSRSRTGMLAILCWTPIMAYGLAAIALRDDKSGDGFAWLAHAAMILLAPAAACGCGMVARRACGGTPAMVSGRTMKSLWAHAFMPVAVLAVASVGTLTVAEVAYGPTGGVDLFFGTVTAGLQVAVAFLTLPIAYLAGLIPSKERSRVLLFAATIASLAFVIAGVIELNVLEAAFAAMAITVAIYATLFARANAMLQAWQDECARDIPADRLTMSATPEPSRPIIPDSA